MPLIDELGQLRDNTVAALDAGDDYFIHTTNAWRLVQELVRQGHKIAFRNQYTGSLVRQDDLPDLAQVYIAGYLAETTFQHLVSLFENFIGDFLRLWLHNYPQSLSLKKVDFQVVLECNNKADIIRAVVERQVASLQYGRLPQWFQYIEEVAKLGCPAPEQIQRLAEIKATRDVLVHNKGIANNIYQEKSGSRARFPIGQRVAVPELNRRESWQLVRQVVLDVSNTAIAKLQP